VKTLLLLLLLPCARVAEAAETETCVVTAAVVEDDQKLATQAVRIAAQLGMPLSGETLEKRPTKPQDRGYVVGAFEPRRGEIHVTAYVGACDRAAVVLTTARAAYPTARVERLELGQGSSIYEEFTYSDVLLVGTYPSFAAARRDALRIAKATGVPYDTRGLTYDHGVFGFADDEDGGYLPRRGGDSCGEDRDAPCLSVERSDGYDGVEGSYVVIGGIDASAQLARFQAAAPRARLNKIAQYAGCRH
jgi:hypothetical protein